MDILRATLLIPLAISLASSCASHNNAQLAELQVELRAERHLLVETRAQLQELVETLKPMLAIIERLDRNAPLSSAHPAPDVTYKKSTTVRVERKLVDAMNANPSQVSRGARIVPSIRAGKPNGFKLYAIRPSSFYAALGFKNGDTVHSVNGMALDSIDNSLRVYNRLRDSPKLVVEITRRGKAHTLTILIN